MYTKFPILKKSIHLVSSEESVEDINEYISEPPSRTNDTEKEHVMVAVGIVIGKNHRKGVLLLDPGYHVARAVTVMEDNKYPHTGWFTQTEEQLVKREYRYIFANNSKLDYVIWEVKETRAGKVKLTSSLVYVKDPYLTAITVTEKRNLVYDYRSWLARSTKGEVIAGVYFKVDESANLNGSTLTIIYADKRGVKQREKIRFEHVYNQNLNMKECEMIEECGTQLGLTKNNNLLQVLRRIAVIFNDSQFIKQVLDINQSIDIGK